MDGCRVGLLNVSFVLHPFLLLSENELTVEPHVLLPSVTSADSYITEMKGKNKTKQKA